MGDGEMGPPSLKEQGSLGETLWRAASICSWLLCGVRAALGAFIPRVTHVQQEKSSGCCAWVCSRC